MKIRNKMQREIDDNVHFNQTVLQFDCIGKPAAIDRTASEFDSANEKVKKIKRQYILENMMLTLHDIYLKHFN